MNKIILYIAITCFSLSLMISSITPELFAKQIKLSQFCTANGNGTMTCCYSLWDDRGTT